MITVDDLRTHLNLDSAIDDALLADKIAAAEAWVLQFTGLVVDADNPAPEPVKEAVRQFAAHLYTNREAVFADAGAKAILLPLGVGDLLAPYRQWGF